MAYRLSQHNDPPHFHAYHSELPDDNTPEASSKYWTRSRAMQLVRIWLQLAEEMKIPTKVVKSGWEVKLEGGTKTARLEVRECREEGCLVHD